jgi:hypothetical protein
LTLRLCWHHQRLDTVSNVIPHIRIRSGGEDVMVVGQRQGSSQEVGTDLLSHAATSAVPSAQVGLTTGFGMGPGVPPPREAPTDRSLDRLRYAVGVNSANKQAAWRPGGRRWGESVKVSVSRQGKSRSTLSTGSLNALRRVHVRPIKLVVYQRSYSHEGEGETHLGASFPLRCFQRLSRPEVATRRCGWRHNRHTSALSTPVLSY